MQWDLAMAIAVRRFPSKFTQKSRERKISSQSVMNMLLKEINDKNKQIIAAMGLWAYLKSV